MLEILTLEDLETVLCDLRAIGTDHQWVEAKASKTSVPTTLWQSVVGFANSDQGGLILLGVEENHGAFDVVGVNRSAEVYAAFASLCANLEPPLRPAIQVLNHPDGIVIASVISPIPRRERPCHKPPDESTTSYIRVGDRDDRLTQAEIDELRWNRSGTDQSRRPAPDGATANLELKAQLLRAARVGSDRKGQMSDEDLLYRIGITDDSGNMTLAGVLSIGQAPETLTNAARVSYRETPTSRDAKGARFVNARHAEGTVGEILDELLDNLQQSLRTAVVVRDGQVTEQLDVPEEALRELLSNALVHRSLSPGHDGSHTLVEVSPSYVLVTSPGSVHPDVTVHQLGLNPLSTPRNRALATACEYLKTPSGRRITEGQASGIPAADRACHDAGTAPALFAAHRTLFNALLLRGRLPVDDFKRTWASRDVTLDDNEARLYAFASALADLHDEDAASEFSEVHLDAASAARALAPCQPERAAGILAAMEAKGVLRAGNLPDRMHWRPLPAGSQTPANAAASASQPAPPETKTRPARARRKERVTQLIEVLREHGPLRQSEITEMLGVSRSTVTNVIKDALNAGLVEASSISTHDPTRTYLLTPSGQKLRS